MNYLPSLMPYLPYIVLLLQIYLAYLWHGSNTLRQNEKNYLKTLVYLDKQKQYVDYDVLLELRERVKFRYYAKLFGNHFLSNSGYQKISEYITQHFIEPAIIKITDNKFEISRFKMVFKGIGYLIVALLFFYLLNALLKIPTSFHNPKSYIIWTGMLMYFFLMQYFIIKIRNIIDAIILVPVLLNNIQFDNMDITLNQKLSHNITKATTITSVLLALLFCILFIFNEFII